MAPNGMDVILVEAQQELSSTDLASSMYDESTNGMQRGILKYFRPLFDDDTQLFDTKYMRRLNVLPGITGLLQINERNTSEFETWYKYDIEYIKNRALYSDVKILLKTPYALFKGKKIKGL